MAVGLFTCPQGASTGTRKSQWESRSRGKIDVAQLVFKVNTTSQIGERMTHTIEGSLISRERIIDAAQRVVEFCHDYEDLNDVRWHIENQAFIISAALSYLPCSPEESRPYGGFTDAAKP